MADILYLLAGADSGDVGVFEVKAAEGPVVKAIARHHNGHSQVVRGFDWHVPSGLLWTGGEDCKVCVCRKV